MRAALVVASIVLVASALWYVVAPPRDPVAYRDRASESAQTLLSQVRTAKTWAETLAEGKTLTTSAAVGLEDADAQAQKAVAKFERYEPPRGTDDVRSRFTTLATRVTDELGRLRIAAQRGEWTRIEEARPRLDELAARLEDFRRALRS